MFLDQDQMYLRMCNVNKEKIFGKFISFILQSLSISLSILVLFDETLTQSFNINQIIKF